MSYCNNCKKTLLELSSFDLSNNFNQLNQYFLLIEYIEESFKKLIISNNNDLSDNIIYSRNNIDFANFILNNDISYNLINNQVFLMNNGHSHEQIYQNNIYFIRRCKLNYNLDNSGNIINDLIYQECCFNTKYRIFNDYKNYKKLIKDSIMNGLLNNIFVFNENDLNNLELSPVNSIWISYNDINYSKLDIYDNNTIIINLEIIDNKINYIYIYEGKLESFS
jgi:hypothetical protein